MTARLTWDTALRFTGTNSKGHITYFDTSLKGGGLDSAASPMETVLEAAAACTAMDVVNILTKRRKQLDGLSIELTADRAETEPRVFTKIHMAFTIESPNVTEEEITRAIELSWEKYCSVSIMLKRSGVAMSYSAEVVPTGVLLERTV